MKISFKEWFYKENTESDTIENLKNSLQELTDKSKHDLVKFFQKAIRTTKDEIKNIDIITKSEMIKEIKNKNFSNEAEKNNEIAELIQTQPFSNIIDEIKNLDQSKKEKFKNNDLEFFKEEAMKSFLDLFSTVPSLPKLLLSLSMKYDNDDIDMLGIAKAFVNPFSYLHKKENYKIKDYINLSNEKFIEEIKRMVISKHKKLQLDKYKSKEISGYGGDDEKSSIADIAVAGLDSRVHRGSKRRSGSSMLSFINNDDDNSDYDNSDYDNSDSNNGNILSNDEFNEFKKIIHEELSKDEFRKFVFCTIEGLEYDKLLVPNYYTSIDEIIRNQNRMKSFLGKSKFLQIYEIIRSMIESSDINKKRKGIKLQMNLGGDEQGNPNQLRGIGNFVTSIGGQYRIIKRNIIAKYKRLSDNPKWISILEKWQKK